MATKKPKGLGRGLEALLGPTVDDTPAAGSGSDLPNSLLDVLAQRSFQVDRNAQGEAKLQLMEAHRVGDPLDETVVIPGIHDGIIYGPYGEYTAVNVYKSDGSNRQILAQSMMHVVDHEYASGCRGVPLLQSSINSIQDEMEILALEKQAVKDNGDVVRTIQKQGGVLDQDTANELGALNVPSYTSIANTMGGKLLVLDQGESMSSFQSNRPNSTFVGFLAALELAKQGRAELAQDEAFGPVMLRASRA